MTTQMWIETIGYIGSGIVLISFLMTSVYKLRVVNTVGSIIFTIYALIIHSYPTAVMNLCLALINIRFLWKMRHTGKEYNLVRVEPEDKYLQHLLGRQRDDIEECFPAIRVHEDLRREEVDRCYIVTCKEAAAGIVLAKETDTGTLELLMDYALPEYRDFSVGLFLAEAFKKEGISRLTYSGPTENHVQYLNKLGFVKEDNQFVKDLDLG